MAEDKYQSFIDAAESSQATAVDAGPGPVDKYQSFIDANSTPDPGPTPSVQGDKYQSFIDSEGGGTDTGDTGTPLTDKALRETEQFNAQPAEIAKLASEPAAPSTPFSRGVERTLEGVIPRTWGGAGKMAAEMVGGFVSPITMEDVQTAKNVGKVIGGAPIEETFQEKPFTKYTTEDWVAFGTQRGVDALMAIPMFKALRPKVQAKVIEQAKAEPEPAAQAEPAEPEFTGRAFTEPTTARVQGVETADVTRTILDRRNELINEGQQLGQQVDLLRKAGQPIHPALEDRIAQINEELNRPATGDLERSFPEGGEPDASSITSATSITEPEIRTQVGEETPLRQQGEVAGAQGEEFSGGAATEEGLHPEVGISEARTEAELGPGSVEPGVGAEMGSGLKFGRKYINEGGDPRLPIRRAESTGLVGKNSVGIVHAELERLRQLRTDAAAALEASPGDPVLQQAFDAADTAQRAWRKELQPVLTKASDALQEAYAASTPQADPSTYQGLSDLFDSHYKGAKEVTPEMRTAMAKGAKGVREGRAIANDSMAEVEQHLAKQMKGKKIMTPEELNADLQRELETQFKDCVLG